jgi:hypothetical protein
MPHLVPLEQEHVLRPIPAVYCELAWALLAADDLELGRKCGNGHQRLTSNVRAWHGKLHAQGTNLTTVAAAAGQAGWKLSLPVPFGPYARAVSSAALCDLLDTCQPVSYPACWLATGQASSKCTCMLLRAPPPPRQTNSPVLVPCIEAPVS